MAVNSARRGIDLPADLSIGFCDKNGVAGSISVVGEACPVRRPCKFGALHLEEGCGGEETLTAGQAFEELHGHIHRAKNMTSEQVEVFNTSLPQDVSVGVDIQCLLDSGGGSFALFPELP